MKKITVLLLLLVFGLLTMVSLVTAGPNPGTGIKLTSHDLSSKSKGPLYGAGTISDSQDRICIYCHAPHHTITTTEAAAAGITYYPLWNHDLSTTTTWTPYQNTDPANPVIPDYIPHQLNTLPGDPSSISKLCLSCHDASVAVSSYGNFDSGAASSRYTGTIKIDTTLNGRFGIGVGGNLQNHHPISIIYADALAADDEIKDPSSPLIGSARGLTINDVLYGGKVECTSCHDVHNTKNEGSKFLWVADTTSNLCFSCHAK